MAGIISRMLIRQWQHLPRQTGDVRERVVQAKTPFGPFILMSPFSREQILKFRIPIEPQ